MLTRVAVPAAAMMIAGLALYVSRGVLDQIVVDDRTVRVALVPPWQAVVGFISLAGLGLFALSRGLSHRASVGSQVPMLAPLTLPLFGLAILLAPFLPGVADWVPALQILAGPLRWIVWLVVAGLVIWTVWQMQAWRWPWIESRQPRHLMLAVALATALVSGVTASRLIATVLFPAGDEPHYLVIAQSIWRDGDLKIENNHTRGDYREYFVRQLDPHFLTRGADGEIYSIHPVGMPFLIAPIYALGGYRAVVFALILCAGIAAALIWRSIVRLDVRPVHATFGWAAIALTTPFLFNTFSVYPEIVAALAVALAFTRMVDADAWPRGTGRWIIVGVACGALPWLSTKYAPMSAALVLVALARIWIRRAPSHQAPLAPAPLAPLAPSLALVVPYGLSLLAWFFFFYAIWGKPLPQAPYGDLVQTRPFNLIFGAPGLLFDQEYGLLPYAPVYILAATGLVAMWRAGGERSRRAIEIALIFTALLATVGAFRIWWGGSASPGRPLASGLLLLAIPIAISSSVAPRASARRAAQVLLLLVSVAVAATLTVAQEGLLLANGRDGTATLLEYLSPRWAAWRVVPTFIHHEAPTALLHAVAWLAIAAAAAFVLHRSRTRTAGGAALAAMTTTGIAVLLVVFLLPLLPAEPPLPSIDLRARARLPLLDGYDASTRPVGVRFDPIRFVSASEVQRTATLEVSPGLRSDPQPVRVLHNGRFSLPAGRYRLDVQWSDVTLPPTPLAIQVGRIGNPWRSWLVTPQPHGTWQTEFALPLDAGFVGFRGSLDLERAIARLTVTPLSVLDAARRPNLPPVLGANEFSGVAVFFHDENSYGEPEGFWIRGERESRVSLQPVDPKRPLMLSIHSGPQANRVTLSMTGWEHTLNLQAHTPQRVQIPTLDRPIVTIGIRTEFGFRPPDFDPGSRDDRYLGAWVQFRP